MGLATITDSADEGEPYTIQIDKGQAVIDAKIAALQADSDALQAAIGSQDAEIATLSLALGSAVSKLNAAIDLYIAALQAGEDPGEQKALVKKRTVAAAEAQSKFAKADIVGRTLKLEKVAIDRRIEFLDGFDLVETRSAWCVDYTFEAGGAVGTIEVPGEPDQIFIVPGCEAPAASDGALLARAAHDPAVLFYNLSSLPAWQKWLPTYRTGQITAIDREEDTCSLDLSPAFSTAQGIGVNQSNSLVDVPIEYMTCDSAAFEVHDEVVVKFEGQNWNSPKVIGFTEDPRVCAPAQVSFLVDPGTAYEAQNLFIGGSMGYRQVYKDSPGDPLFTYGLTTQASSYVGHTETTYTRVTPDELNFGSASNEGPPGPRIDVTHHADMLIRFDRAFTADRLYEESWATGFGPLRTDIEAVGYGKTGELPASAELDTSVFPEAYGVPSASLTVRHPPDYIKEFWEEYYVEPGGSEELLAWSAYLWVGTQRDETMRVRTVVGQEATRVEPDLYSDFWLDYFAPPSPITLDIEGVETEYVVRYLGPYPGVQIFSDQPWNYTFLTYVRKDLENKV
ncbi:MAG: hypothetical protein Hals2KO_21700 [Halioglobus sp.]